MKFYDSPETEKLKKLIADKKQYLTKLDKNKFAYQQIQNEIMFLENDILPLTYINSNVVYSEFTKYAVKCFDVAVAKKMNGFVLYQSLFPNNEEHPQFAIFNSDANKATCDPNRIELFVDTCKGVHVKLNNLMPLIS